jgi:tRNA pseudouridine38-40 synthase
MAHYKVILTYDGTEFQGFQRQPEVRTVQGTVESALQAIGWQDSAILAAGRTDTGVHASGQVVAFDFQWEHSPQELRDALNANLPLDVAAQLVEPVNKDFHPRYSAKARRYHYRVFSEEVRQPLRERYAWRIWPPASIAALQEAATQLNGTYDFSAFGTPAKPGGSTIREIFASTWSNEQDEMVYEILGNAFLYHMVRRLVNLQVEIGQGKRKVDEIIDFLGSMRKESVQGLAPAQGLSLVEVLYPPEFGGN